MDKDKQSFDLPYFDTFLRVLKDQDSPALETMMGVTVHWGYWKNPKAATCTPEDFRAATDNLTRELLNWVDPKPGQQILDDCTPIQIPPPR